MHCDAPAMCFFNNICIIGTSSLSNSLISHRSQCVKNSRAHIFDLNVFLRKKNASFNSCKYRYRYRLLWHNEIICPYNIKILNNVNFELHIFLNDFIIKIYLKCHQLKKSASHTLKLELISFGIKLLSVIAFSRKNIV